MDINELPIIGSTYRHKNGNTYKVMLIANIHSINDDYPVTIVYEGYSNKRIWAKPLDNFLQKMSLVPDKESA
jgi:hypothetical protein